MSNWNINANDYLKLFRPKEIKPISNQDLFDRVVRYLVQRKKPCFEEVLDPLTGNIKYNGVNVSSQGTFSALLSVISYQDFKVLQKEFGYSVMKELGQETTYKIDKNTGLKESFQFSIGYVIQRFVEAWRPYEFNLSKTDEVVDLVKNCFHDGDDELEYLPVYLKLTEILLSKGYFLIKDQEDLFYDVMALDKYVLKYMKDMVYPEHVSMVTELLQEYAERKYLFTLRDNCQMIANDYDLEESVLKFKQP